MNTKCLIILVGLVFVGLITHAQGRIEFDYDETGNREKREFINLSKSAIIPDSEWNEALEDKLSNYEIKIYPNPTKGKIKVSIPSIDKSLDGCIEVYDSNGRLIFKSNSIKNTNEIDIMHVRSGFYFLNIHYLDENLKWKIIKQ